MTSDHPRSSDVHSTWSYRAYAYAGPANIDRYFAATPYQHADEEPIDDVMLMIMFITWVAMTVFVLGLMFTRQVLFERPLEERRRKEIEELIAEQQHLWKTAECSSTNELVTTCSLCLEDFIEDELVLKLPCGHTYHTSCVQKWFESTPNRARSCPHCRQNPLVSDAEFEQAELDRHVSDAAQRLEGAPILPAFTPWVPSSAGQGEGRDELGMWRALHAAYSAHDIHSSMPTYDWHLAHPSMYRTVSGTGHNHFQGFTMV